MPPEEALTCLKSRKGINAVQAIAGTAITRRIVFDYILENDIEKS
ncbi:hypothetical protein L249_5286, partial [Ophiocordyceps polyrhachis-furcata BCC 54312]